MDSSSSLTTLHRMVLYLPAVTTLFAAVFCYQLFSRYRDKGGGLHLLWWGLGMATYGIGTLTEAATSIFGWNPIVFRLWYVSGAFLGGYPLAQGSIYLLMNRRFAHRSAVIVPALIAAATVVLFLTPLDPSLADPHRLSGKVIEWQWVRLISPFFNLYAVVFLVGGAIVSALRFRRAAALRHRYLGNIWIAVGAILPGIGGALTRADLVEALYVTELVGLLCIYVGYRLNIVRPAGAAMPSSPPLRRSAALLVLFLSPALLASPSLGQEASPPEDTKATEEEGKQEEKTEEEIKASFYATTTVTPRGRETEVLETATPVLVLEREEIERRQPKSAADMLRYEPGVDVDGVSPNQTRPVIRGQRGLRVLFLADGLRMNNPRRQTDFGETPGLVNVDTVQRMEVVRGPASVLYGSDAIGGVLNLVTRRARGSGTQGSVQLGFDSAGDGVSAHGGLSHRGRRWSLRLDASTRDTDDYEAPAGRFGDIRLEADAPVLDTRLEDDTLAGTFHYDLSEGSELSVKHQRYRADQTGFGLVEPALLGDDNFRIRILYPFQDFDRTTLGYLGSNLGLPFADSVEARLYRQVNERELANDIDVFEPAAFPGAPGVLVEIDTLNFTDIETTGLRVEARKGISDRHLLTWGLDAYEDDSFNTDQSLSEISLVFDGPPFVVPIGTVSDDVANTPNAENSSYGLFAQAELAPSDRLSLTLGARHQQVETLAKETPGWDIIGLDFDDDATVGSLALLYQLTDELRLYGSFGTAFRAPNIVERLFNGPTPEGAGFQILNAELESERSETFDLGLKYGRSNALFELTVFRNDITDGIIQDFLTPEEIAQLPPDLQMDIAAIDPAFVVQQVNADRLRFEGVELAVAYRAPRGFSLGANYTHIDGKRLDTTNPPTGDTFSDKLNAYARWQPSAHPLWLEARVRHNGDDRANLDPGEPVPPVGEVLPSFTIYSLAGGWTFLQRERHSHEITLRLHNLTDELYAEFSNATFFRPQPGRSVRASYRLRF